MNLNIFYYLSVVLLVIINILFLENDKYNNKCMATLVLLSIIIFVKGNYNLLNYKKDEKYIYVKPNYKPIVISWDNQLAQKII
jgi:hypothetical protein